MKTTLITPEFVRENFGPQENPIISISKMNIYFNRTATKLLALKKGDTFQFEIQEDGKTRLFYKDSPSGFKITTISEKGLAQLINKEYAMPLHTCLNKYFKSAGKSFRFELGEFKDGRRELVQIGG